MAMQRRRAAWLGQGVAWVCGAEQRQGGEQQCKGKALRSTAKAVDRVAMDGEAAQSNGIEEQGDAEFCKGVA